MSAPRYAVNCSILFSEVPLLERPAAAKQAGFDAVEFWWPFPAAVPGDAEVDRFVGAVVDAGVQLIGLNFAAGDMPGGDRGLLSWPARSGEFRDNVDVTIGIGERLGCRAFNARPVLDVVGKTIVHVGPAGSGQTVKAANQLNHVLARHVEGASHMADGYTRTRAGNIGVCIGTSGPAGTDMITGLYAAIADSVPILAITGQAPVARLHKEDFQAVDIASIAAPVTKMAVTVLEAAQVPGVFQKAFHLMRSGRPGPVLIDLPSCCRTPPRR